MHILSTAKLSKTYGTGTTRIDALRGVDLSVEEGEFLAIIGPSGSGKSTLLHLLGGLDRPTGGHVYVDGKDLYAMNERQLSLFRRRQVGFIFQFYNLIPVLSAEENIVLPLLLDNRRVDSSYLHELIGHLGLSDRRTHMPNELSGGQQQRVSIGRALVTRPAIILADEPTGNLDRRTGREILDLLRLSVRAYKQTLIIITHDLEAASEADRIVSIEDGVLQLDKAVPV